MSRFVFAVMEMGPLLVLVVVGWEIIGVLENFTCRRCDGQGEVTCPRCVNVGEI